MTQEPMVFEVGDKVTIVSKPYRDCPFHWASDMDKYCGLDAEIKSRKKSVRGILYKIDVDNRNFNWCGMCFVPYEESADFDIPDEEFNRILMC